MAKQPVKEPAPFWDRLTLREMSPEQWEALCDQCGRCCLHKLQDENTDEVHYSDVACRLLDNDTGRCTDYAHRTTRVPECVSMRPDDYRAIAFLPSSCAYRRLHEGRGLAPWHPLISGRAESVREAGISVAGQCVSETQVDVDDIGLRLRPDIHWQPLDPDLV